MKGTDWPAVWTAIAAVGSVASAAVAAWAARQSRLSAGEANSASKALADIERDRRHSELIPRFRVVCERGNPGTDNLGLRVMLLGPPGLERIDSLAVTNRDDHFRRGDWPLTAGGPTREEIKEQIWGPYRFTPGTGPDDARADRTGRTTEYDYPLPVGEELPFQLEPTWAPPWSQMSREDWRRQRGTVIRLAFTARHNDHGVWTLPCEINVPSDPEVQSTVFVPDQAASSGDIT